MTELYSVCKRKRLSFYYALIYLCCKALSDVPAFGLRIRGKRVVALEEQIPSFTDLKKGSELFYEVNHRLIDGVHIGRFAEALTRRIQALGTEPMEV